MSRMEMRCGNPKCERCGKESVITIWHKSYDANLCGDCYKDANKNKKLFLTGVEVAPITHAHWHIEPDPFFDGYRHTCSACGWVKHCGLEIFEMFDYCPNCGAKMDEE